MKILVIGTGQLAKFRARLLAQDPRIEWVGLASSDRDRAARTAAEIGVNAGDSVASLLADDLDGVIISSATADHPAHLEKAMRVGVPILCEKPLATTIAGNKHVESMADINGITVQVGFQRRFDVGFREARDKIREGRIGSIYKIRLTSHDYTPPPRRYMPTRSSVFRDLHVHDFDLARWLTGDEIESVYAVGTNRTSFDYLAEYNDPDVMSIVLKTVGGMTIDISGAQHSPVGHDVRGEVFGSLESLAIGFDGSLALNPVPHTEQFKPVHRFQNFMQRFEGAFMKETAHFVGLIAGEQENPCLPKSSTEAIKIAAAAEESLVTGRPVMISEIAVGR